MRNRTIQCLALIAFCVCGHAGLGQERTPIAAVSGVWRAQDSGHPAITLVVTDEGGSLTGAIHFFFPRLDSADVPLTFTAGLPEPLLRPQFVGTTLRFEVSHRRANPPRSLSDPPAQFHLTLTGPDTAEIVNESEPDLAVPMIRSDH